MERRAFHVLDQRHLVDQDVARSIPHDAGDHGGLTQALLLHQQFERAIAAAAGAYLAHARLLALAIEGPAAMQALDEAVPGDGLGPFLNPDAGLDVADVVLA